MILMQQHHQLGPVHIDNVNIHKTTLGCVLRCDLFFELDVITYNKHHKIVIG